MQYKLQNLNMLTIFTPTYNRLYTLNRLYESLCKQTDKAFEWLVVDDGSTDGTEGFFQGLKQKEFVVRYVRQSNGGKHRAINRGVPLAHGEWFLIVDSDDLLADNAVETISRHTATIENDPKFCAVVGNKVNFDKQVVGTPCNYEILDTDFLSYRNRYHIIGDRAEVVRTSVMREYPFPEFEGENFCTEAVVWNRMAQKYKARYVNEDFYICEYQPDGLTANVALIHHDSPQGSALCFKEMSTYKQLTFHSRLIAYMAYWRYYVLCQNPCEEIRPSLKLRLIGRPLSLLYRIARAIFKRNRAN